MNTGRDVERGDFFVLVNGERVDVADTTFIDIEEDFYGRDLMTFEFHDHQYKSRVYRW
jgi:hypothetical protein